MKKILIIDPVYTRLLLEKTCLSRKEHKVFAVTKGLEGLEIAKNEKPNLILFSTEINDIDPVEFCKKIRADEETKKTSLLMIVVKQDDKKINEVMSSGCNDFITFPLNKLILDQKLEIYLNIATRKAVRVMVQLRIETRSYQGFHLGTSVNLSKSGMLLETPTNLNVGDEIYVKFFLPKRTRQIETKAIIVRQEMEKNIKRYGIKFIGISEEFEKMIEEFIGEE